MTLVTPRMNKDFTEYKEVNHEIALLMGDKGMWTIFQITKEKLAMVGSEADARNIIKQLGGKVQPT